MVGLSFVGITILWLNEAWSNAKVTLVIIPFIAVGLWIASKPIRIFRRANRTYYAITNKRIVILTTGSTYRVITIGRAEIDDYERIEKQDGSGNIRLRRTISHTNDGTSTSVEFGDGLWGVKDLRGAAEAIIELLDDRDT